MDTTKRFYPVLPGCRFGAYSQWTEGMLVELTEAEARPNIGIVLGEAVEPKGAAKPAEPETPAKPAEPVKAKEKKIDA